MKRLRFENRRQTDGDRGGAILVAAMICLMLISMILGTLLRLTLLHRKQIRGEERRLQSVWLVESGIERAARRLADDVSYSGETWNVSAQQLDGHHSAHVTIRVQKLEDDPAGRRVEVQAIYPAESPDFVKRTKRVTVRVKTKS